MTEPKLMDLALDDLEFSSAIQVRVKLDPHTIERYTQTIAELIAAGEPPELGKLTVFVENGSNRYLVADGFHRGPALKANGVAEHPCKVYQGGVREALAFALSVNNDHGLPRNNRDKRNAVEIALKDPEWCEWNNVAIAKLCAVSETLVRTIKDELQQAGEIDRRDTVKQERAGETVERKATRAHSNKTNERDSSGKSKLTDQQKAVAKGVQRKVERQKRKSLEDKNRDDFFAGIAGARTAAVASGRELVTRWNCQDRRDELVYLRDLISEMIQAIDEKKAA